MSEWQRPKGCSTLECIEVRFGLASVEIRTSRYAGADPLGVALASPDEWRVFVAAVKNGEFDVPEL